MSSKPAPAVKSPRPKKSGGKNGQSPGKNSSGGQGSEPKALSRTFLKGQMRSLVRLLKKDSIPDEKKAEFKKTLDGLQQQLDSTPAAEPNPKPMKKKDDSVKKYKEIRFLEKTNVNKKLVKKEKQLKSLLRHEARLATLDDTTPEELEQQKTEIETVKLAIAKLKEDLLYIKHYPKDKKYIALYPKPPMTNEAILKQQAEIRAEIVANFKEQPKSKKPKKVEPEAEPSGDESDGEAAMEEDDFFVKPAQLGKPKPKSKPEASPQKAEKEDKRPQNHKKRKADSPLKENKAKRVKSSE